MAWTYVSAPELSDAEFSQWRGLLESRIGMSLASHQKPFLQHQVAMRMRELGEHTFSTYLKRILEPRNGAKEWSTLVDRLVINETSFFRHQPSYDFVKTAFSNYVSREKPMGLNNRTFDVWSLGCSTGEEAYSLAMLFNEKLDAENTQAYFSVTATDVSREAIASARAAQYSARKIEQVEQSLVDKYFRKIDSQRHEFVHNVKEKICFSTTNILKESGMLPLKFDLVFCQNLLVYFQQALRQNLLDRVVDQLKPGGVLVIGLGEVINWSNPSVSKVARNDVQAYVRVGGV